MLIKYFLNRKDDYAFFLTPVNAANVQGYSDIIKFPMDFGTMTDKVNRGKYRSLDDFAVRVTFTFVIYSKMMVIWCSPTSDL